MSEIFSHYLLIVIAACLVFYGIGLIIFKLLRFRPDGVFTAVFLKLFVGCFSFTAICALYFTSLKSIFCGLAIPLIYLLVGYWKRLGGNAPSFVTFRKELYVICVFLLGLTLIYSYRFYTVSYNGDSILNIPNPDFTFYARISHALIETGVESATPSLIYPELHSVNPYHYFDIWITGGISYFVGGNNLQVLFLVTYTLGIALVWLGFCSLAEHFKKLNIFNVILALFATFFIPLPWFLSESIDSMLSLFFILTHAPAEYIDYGLWNMTKIYPVYLVIIVAMLAFLKNEKVLGISVLAVLPLIYTTISIPIMLTLSVYVLYDYVFISRDKRFFIHGIVFLLSMYIFIFLFYYSYLSNSAGGQLDPFHRLGVEPLYKSILRPVKIFFDATLQLLILLLPFLALLLLELKNKLSLRKIPGFIYQQVRKNSNTHIAVILYISALATWCILFDIVDANQFFATSAVPMVNVFCFILVAHLSKVYLKILAALLCVYFVNIATVDILEQRLYSENYMKELKEITKTTGRISGFLLTKRDYEEGYGDNIVEVLGQYITLFRPDNYEVNLSITEVPVSPEKIESDSMKQELAKHDFYQFILRQKEKNEFNSVAQSRIDFIDEFNLDYLIASPYVELDSLISKRVNRTITDIYSRQVFILLNK